MNPEWKCSNSVGSKSASQVRSAVVNLQKYHPQVEGPDGDINFADDDWPSHLNNMPKDGTWSDAHVVYECYGNYVTQ